MDINIAPPLRQKYKPATQKNGWICFVYNGTADFFAFFFVLTGLLKLLPLLKSDALLATPDLIYIVGGFVELAIGIWWVFDVRRKLRYYVTLTMLALLVAIGIKFSLDGLTSCGCYGLVQTPPIVSLSIASILFAWLIVFRHRFDGTRKPWHDRLTLGGIAGILVGIGLFGLSDRDGLVDAWANFGVSTSPADLSLSYDPIGPVKIDKQITIRNFNPRPVRVVGFAKGAGCTDFKVDGLPLKLASGGSGTLKIQFENAPTKEQIDGLVANIKTTGVEPPNRAINTIHFITNTEDGFTLRIIEDYDLRQLRQRLDF